MAVVLKVRKFRTLIQAKCILLQNFCPISGKLKLIDEKQVLSKLLVCSSLCGQHQQIWEISQSVNPVPEGTPAADKT